MMSTSSYADVVAVGPDLVDETFVRRTGGDAVAQVRAQVVPAPLVAGARGPVGGRRAPRGAPGVARLALKGAEPGHVDDGLKTRIGHDIGSQAPISIR